MIFRNLASLSLGGFSFRRASTISPLLSVAMASGATLVLLSLVLGVRKTGVGGILSTLPITRMVVAPKQVDVLFFRMGSPLASFEPSLIDSLQRIDGVRAVWPEMVMTMPTTLFGNLLGNAFTTDCAVYGVDAGFFPEEERTDEFSPAPEGEPVPAVLSTQLVDLYNSGFAGAQNLPSLSHKALIGRHFTLYLGTSSFFPAPPGGKVKSVRCRIVGLSNLVSVTGVTVPRSSAASWHDWYYGGLESEKFASLHVILESSDKVADARMAIETMGLHARSGRELAEKIALISKYLSVVTAALVALFLLLAGLGTANTLSLEVSFQAQRIGLYRSLGASRSDILGIYLFRAAVLGAFGSALGLVPAAGLLTLADGLLQKVLPFLAGLPSSPLRVSLSLFVIAFLLGVAASTLAGIGPARRAANVDPVVALRSQET